MDEPASIMSHVSIGTNNVERSLAFYDRVLGALGASRIMEHPGAIAYGKSFPEFWVQIPYDGKPASTGNGVHFGFLANSKADVDAFYQAAIEAGAQPDGPPGPREEYSAAYYGCFVRDPDGHKIEATFWDADKNDH
jgi:catechol 2,3-dioxygenase-like lactoylglutathione lyase family enzyme